MIKDYSKYSDAESLQILNSSNKRIKEEGFLEVYNRYNRLVFTYINKIINNTYEVNDIFQDVFLKFVDLTNKKHEIENVKFMLITISRNLCFNYLKRKKEVYVEDLEELVIDDDIVEESDVMKILHRGMDMLDDGNKDLILLKYYDGFSYDELEKITGLTTHQLKNRIWRAKEKLKIILRPYLKDIQNEIEN